MSDTKSEQLTTTEAKSPFLIRSFNEVQQLDLPPIKELIGNLIYPKEQTIIFGTTNVGKSIFAMQLAMVISKGEDLNLGNGVVLKNECDAMNVVYYDFELSDSQLQLRYQHSESYPNLFYAKISRGEILDTKPLEVFASIKRSAFEKEARCIVIDNITAISGDLEKTENAKQFMQQMWSLARFEDFTIIILTHTPKTENYKSIELNDLKGSSVLSQLADNIIGISKVNCSEENEFYIKQIKVRNSSKTYNSSNVIHTKIDDVGNLKYYAIGLANEQELLIGEYVNSQPDQKMLCVYATLYYGSLRSAEYNLKVNGVKHCSHVNIRKHYKSFEQKDSKALNILKEKTQDELKLLLDEKSSNGSFPFKDGHINNDDKIAF
jgi:KaiC/GvpD/RAD55 family RecA-like ATPase